MNLAACDEIGSRQDGLITRRQAMRVLSEDQIAWLVKLRIWIPIYPGVYRMTGVPLTWHRLVLGATLARPDALASHYTAAALWGLSEGSRQKIELVAPMSNSARLPNVTMHRTRVWHDSMRATVHGIPSTRPARTLVDISINAPEKSIKHALDAGITCGLFTFNALMSEIDRNGPIRTKKLSAILSRYDGQFEKTKSVKEIDVLRWIRDARLPEPVPQFEMWIAGEQIFPDFAYPDRKIAIESQSWRWHGGPSRFERDAHKGALLRSIGWDVLPVLPRPDNRDLFIQALSRLLHG